MSISGGLRRCGAGRAKLAARTTNTRHKVPNVPQCMCWSIRARMRVDIRVDVLDTMPQFCPTRSQVADAAAAVVTCTCHTSARVSERTAQPANGPVTLESSGSVINPAHRSCSENT